MKRILFSKSLFLLITTLVFTSCKKSGCMDADATNYDAKAKKEDHSCQYEGNVVFWNNQATSVFLVGDGATTLIYYVDGVLVGSTSTNVFWSGSPDCGQNGSVTVTKKLGNVKNKSYSYSIKDQTGFEYYNGVLNFTANTCESTELN